MNKQYEGKKILVAGMGLSGRSAVSLLVKEKAEVTAYDSRSISEINSLPEDVIKLFNKNPREINPTLYDLIILSPGIPPHNPIVVRAIEKGVKIKSELQLGLEYCPDLKIAAVTGTNGKTTTCSIIKDLSGGYSAGNMGKPLSSEVNRLKKDDLLILEVSSYQIPYSPSLQPDIGVLLNIFPEHLTWHRGEENYIKAKKQMFLRQRPNQISVFNARSPGIKDFVKEISSRKMFFDIEKIPYNGTGVEKGEIYFSSKGKKEHIASLRDFKLKGKHNIENLLAAFCVSRLANSWQNRSVSEIKPLPHRLEEVGTYKGVKYINDSKSTNFHSTLKAVESQEGPFILLMGGRSKGIKPSKIGGVLRGNLKKIIVFGESRQELYHTFKGRVSLIAAPGLKEALLIAAREAEPGMTVLLSPGGSSFDQFDSYAERGEKFKEWLKEKFHHHINQV